MPRSLAQPETMEDILKNVRLSPKLRIDKDAEGNHSKSRPRLLFRAFQPSHGFTARRFVNSETEIPKAPKFGTPDFLHEVEPHLRLNNKYQSPVLSFTEWPRYALSIVNEADPERSLAVFDILDLEQDSRSLFGKGCKLYLVPVLCKRYNLYDLPGSYTGRGEWLIWGDIKCKPVIIFNKESALELRQTLLKMSGLNKSTGEELGKLLKDVQDEYKEILARSLVKSFKVTGCDSNYNKPLWLEFADALYSTNNGNREASVVRNWRGGFRVDSDGEEIRHDEADIWSEFSEPLGMDGNELSMMEEALEELKMQGRDILREAQAAAAATTTTTTTRADVTVLEGLHDWADVTPAPPSMPSAHAIDIPASPSASSTQAQSIIDLTAETAEHDSDGDDDSFFEVEMEVTSTPPQRRGEGQDDDNDLDLVIISHGHHHHHQQQLQTMPMRAKSQSVVLISSQPA